MVPPDQILARSLDLVLKFSATQRQYESLAAAIRIQNSYKRPDASRHASSLISLVHAAVSVDVVLPLDIAAAILVHMMGRALLDDLADGDLATDFAGEDPLQIQITGVLLFTAMPQLFLLGAALKPKMVLEMQASLLQAITRMGDGQQLDLMLRNNRGIDTAAAWDCVALKSGSFAQLLAEWGALSAGATEAQRQCYAEFGHALGCQWSITGDWRDLMLGAGSEDLRNGTQTWPLTLLLSGLKGMEHQRFAVLLDDARSNADSREEVKAQLLRSGVCRLVDFAIESCAQRARKALECAKPAEPARTALFTEFLT